MATNTSRALVPLTYTPCTHAMGEAVSSHVSHCVLAKSAQTFLHSATTAEKVCTEATETLMDVEKRRGVPWRPSQKRARSPSLVANERLAFARAHEYALHVY
eukprot:5093192-Pleurochrysis_carterae.AAC.1